MTGNQDKGAISDWWRDNPQTYGEAHGQTDYQDGAYTFGTKAFFERVDNEFIEWNRPLHDKKPFDRIFPYADYGAGAKVLEIGCGMGTMAMHWAKNGSSVTAVDLNPKSIEQTKTRFDEYGLRGVIQTEDANALSFEPASFDYTYSWGVLHHSPDLARSISEMMRVLKPGGGFGLMLYNRESLLHRYMTEYIEGFIHYENRFLGPLQLASRYGDAHREEGNPHTWPVTRQEILHHLSPYSRDLENRLLGTDLDSVFKYLLPGIGMVMPVWAKKVWARRFGWSIWISGTRER